VLGAYEDSDDCAEIEEMFRCAKLVGQWQECATMERVILVVLAHEPMVYFEDLLGKGFFQRRGP
jgi:hypothetical protein